MDDKPILKFPVGTVLIFTSGEYLDFGLAGELVTIKDCDLKALAQECQNFYEAKESEDRFVFGSAHNNFASWLVANGHAMPLDCTTVHIGDYSEWDEELEVKT